MKFYVFGGNSRTNASIALNGMKNDTFKAGQLLTVDASAGLVVLVQPNANNVNGSFSFKYGVSSGERYPFYEKYFLGKDGETWQWVAVGVASFMALMLLIVILLCIIKCCRACCCKQKVTPTNDAHNKSLADQPLDKSRQTSVQMGATVKLDDLLPEQDENFQSEVYANNNTRGGYNRGGRAGMVAPPPVPPLKSLDDKHWLNNLPQPVNESARSNQNEETRMNNNPPSARNNPQRASYGSNRSPTMKKGRQ